jgi:hypothetical protein
MYLSHVCVYVSKASSAAAKSTFFQMIYVYGGRNETSESRQKKM